MRVHVLGTRNRGVTAPPDRQTSLCGALQPRSQSEGQDGTMEKAPPRMRWRGPPDRTARTPLAHAQHPCCSIGRRAGYPPEVPMPRFPCVRSAPGWCPFSVVRAFYARGQGRRKGLW